MESNAQLMRNAKLKLYVDIVEQLLSESNPVSVWRSRSKAEPAGGHGLFSYFCAYNSLRVNEKNYYLSHSSEKVS